MKVILLLIIGGILGVVAVHFYHRYEAGQCALAARAPAAQPTANPPATTPAAPSSGDSGDESKDAFSRKLADWHLTPDDIRNDLAKTGEVVRTKAHEVGEKIDDARIVAIIKAKFVLDRDLSALDISVASHQGDVTLGGTVAAPGLIGKAIVLSLDTEGVHSVDSKLHVAARP